MVNSYDVATMVYREFILFPPICFAGMKSIKHYESNLEVFQLQKSFLDRVGSKISQIKDAKEPIQIMVRNEHACLVLWIQSN